jgi:hypothetical protein
MELILKNQQFIVRTIFTNKQQLSTIYTNCIYNLWVPSQKGGFFVNLQVHKWALLSSSAVKTIGGEAFSALWEPSQKG